MDAFVAHVFAERDTFSFSASVPTRWLVWLRPSTSSPLAMTLLVCVGVDGATKCFEKQLLATELQAHMQELGVNGDLGMFAAPFKTALESAANVSVSVEDNGSACVNITYLFGPSLLRRGHFLVDAGQALPDTAYTLLVDLHGLRTESAEDTRLRRMRRSALLQPTTASAPLSFTTAPATTSSTSTVPNPLKRKAALPMGARYASCLHQHTCKWFFI
ncbi:hypothetical protein SPRG_06350 [Saprolegnia parasitica CBS 223.65]|uniref:Uncharacterized protein n=1 Tax=Saprolegnia parasitica (strain CBS 223.65) TaxID=695850 RepID=A0A067CGK8_SAPPC|nr:hypothetical protein SPRG_06350 [Saprolegnia parasitica CBS 223.65]KDO28300.1 hypothetical protein SPRG_06350 [Saprolegnia parasitica CBS 223.65]|eukprot:XP_012201119.1 hypothetical protein SPRG_06350 [Saprolegnia parasitica CBS 223.65]